MAVTGILGIIALFLCCLVLLAGHTFYSPYIVVQALLGEDLGGASYTVRSLRFPRMLGGLFAGFAFGLGGSVFQTLLRNPLANPNTIGITAGSGAGAVLCIIVLRASAAVTYSISIIAGLFCTVAVYFFSFKGRFSIGRMILVGIGMQAMLNAFISYLLIISAAQDVSTAMRWLSGSLNGLQMDRLYPVIVLTAVGTPIILLMGKPLAIFELGEEAATVMGVHTGVVRSTLIVCSVVLIAVATAATGPISFVSFLAGPIAKRLVGNGNISPLPAGLFGAALTLTSDLIGQFAFAQRFPVGVITGLLGAPYLIYLLIRMNQRGEL